MAGMAAGPEVSGGTNHPLATRMAVLAFLCFNMTIGTIFGAFGVLLPAVEARLGVDQHLATLGIPAMTLTTSLCAPLVGMLAARISLRAIMTFGGVLLTAGFTLLASTHTVTMNILAYALLMGPGMAIGVVTPATLVTRWFVANRGKALGILHTPLMVAVVPLIVTAVLARSDLTTTYFVLAGLALIPVFAGLLVRDHPPATADAATVFADEAAPQAAAQAPAAPAMLPARRILGSSRFWAAFLGAAASMTSSVILGTFVVKIGLNWGFDQLQGTFLFTIMSLAGLAGTPFFGWLADRIGGLRAVAIIVFNCAWLWLVLLLHPPFPATLVVLALIGAHGSGITAALTMALSQTFGQANFSRAYGLSNFFNLPFSMLCVPAAAWAFGATSTYDSVIIGQAAFFAILLPLLYVAIPKRTAAAEPVPAVA